MIKRPRVPMDLEKLVEASTLGRCFICEFLRGSTEFAHVTVAQTETAIAFLSKYPTLFGYIIVAPKEHREHVTGDFDETEYIELQRFIFRIAEAIRHVLAPERIYILSLGSRAANTHVHWHVAPLPAGIPLEQQQYYALMTERGIIEVNAEELQTYVARLQRHLLQHTPSVDTP